MMDCVYNMYSLLYKVILCLLTQTASQPSETQFEVSLTKCLGLRILNNAAPQTMRGNERKVLHFIKTIACFYSCPIYWT